MEKLFDGVTLANRRSRYRLRLFASAVLVVFCASSPLLAQTEPATRAEALSEAREEKERSAEPYQFNSFEKVMSYLEERPLFGRDGLYPKLGSLTVGSGVAFGAGYRTREPFKRYGTLDVWAAGSRLKYWAAEVRAIFPQLAGGRILAEGYAGRRSYPREKYFGLGPDSNRSEEANYLSLDSRVGGRAG